MKWLLFAVVVSSPLWAADRPRQPFTACDADRARFCRSAAGIPAIVACLQAQRPSLSKACSALLSEHGQ